VHKPIILKTVQRQLLAKNSRIFVLDCLIHTCPYHLNRTAVIYIDLMFKTCFRVKMLGLHVIYL